ncbi:MAG: LPP20 family lipoprotein, partial [Gemmatimonadaceae bacterium]|nr:LPP20 family lipoprotein [Gemmatimonadaceae bacterium]
MRPILILSGVLLAVACGGKRVDTGPAASKAVLNDMPGWYKKPPRSDDYAYGAATATSRDVQVALNKATAEGRNAIAQQLEVKYAALSKRFVEETGQGRDAQLLDEYQNTYKGVVSQALYGSRAKEQTFKVDDGVYRAYVLMELPLGEAAKKLLAQIKAQEQLYTRA